MKTFADLSPDDRPLQEVRFALNTYKSAVAHAGDCITGRAVASKKLAEKALRDWLWENREEIAVMIGRHIDGEKRVNRFEAQGVLAACFAMPADTDPQIVENVAQMLRNVLDVMFGPEKAG